MKPDITIFKSARSRRRDETDLVENARRSASSLRRLLLATVLLTVWNSNAVIPSPGKLLPDDTLMMLTAPDFGKLRRIWNTSPETRLWNDPAMKPFKDKFFGRLKEELIEPLERDLGLQVEDFTGLPQGQ